MRWIGLTGGIATGKSTVAKILRDLGLPVVDADQLAREAAGPGSEGLKSIVNDFGKQILDAKSELDRKKLGQIIFNDSKKREKLDAILHPIIQKFRTREKVKIENLGADIAFYDVPLLFEKNLEKEFDATVLVYCNVDEQRRRLKERENLDDSAIEARLKSQLPIDEKLKRSNFIILNQGSLSELKLNVLTILKELQTSQSK